MNVEVAHKYCRKHRNSLEVSQKCGCFHCLKIFDPKEIVIWLNEGTGTAMCPYCGIDAILGDKDVGLLTPEFLQKMHDFWFGG
ncbi:hypothetical protein [Magnetovibrio blakemorei]|uniref:hypothetical protein n=1 Tax=Magnetovibrio blakemorei TaxID=28181 RepID=UPI000A07293C|nr:hypothetical protein [Magnetovibrio blakemorei]